MLKIGHVYKCKVDDDDQYVYPKDVFDDPNTYLIHRTFSRKSVPFTVLDIKIHHFSTHGPFYVVLCLANNQTHVEIYKTNHVDQYKLIC